MSLKLQSLSQDNIPGILEIETNSFPEPWSKDGFRDLLANPSFNQMGLFRGDQLVGYIFFYCVMDELHIMNIAVHPNERKKGFGEQLLEYVHDFGRKHEIKFAYLEVRETNDPAQKLYEKMGYRKQGRRIGYYANQEDALLMLKELDAK
jgi:ribosomal-protein-alanine N-acetyltransferase